MKYRILIAFLILMVLSSCTARRFYEIRSSEPQKPHLQKYENIHLGWLPVDEDEWQKYRYSSKKEWTDTIGQLNIDHLQSCVKEYLPMKNITGAMSGNDNVIPKQTELFVKFNSVKIGNYAGTALIDVDFIDVKTNAIVYKVSSEIYIKGVHFYLESTAATLMCYTASFLYYQLTD